MNNSDSSNRTPDLNIPDSKKDKEWHKQFVQSITSASLNSTYSLNYASMNECVNFYQGIQSGDEFNFLQEAEDGDALPAQWINFNGIKVKVDLLLGELSEKGYDIKVHALNKEARSRKLKEKERLRVEMRLAGTAADLEERYQLPVQEQGFIPSNEEQLDDFFENSYKEQSEIVMEAALKYLAKLNKWDYERIALFRDILIMGRCFVKNEIINGLPRSRRVDPRLMIYDVNSKDDFLSDSTYFGEVYYMPIAEAAERYGLTLKQLKEVYNTYKNYAVGKSGAPHLQDFTSLDNSSLKFFKHENGELRVLVVMASWLDSKDFSHKYSEDNYGNIHIKKVDGEKAKDNASVKRKRIQIWRQGTLIGGKILKEWGEVPNQARSGDNLAVTKSPYSGLIPNYFNGAGISKVMQLKGLQKLKDITLYNIQLAMARAGAKGFVYDVAQVPDEWDVHTVIKYLKTVGIGFIDSKKDGSPAQFNQFQTFDMTLSASVSQYLDISMMIDREMDAISGINEARQGIIQNASQAVGVTQSALLQSNLSTAVYFKEFEQFCSDSLNHQASLVKIAWAGKERFAPIIGETGINFLETDIDLELNDYGVFVETIPPAIDDINNFHQLVIAALQAGQIEFVDAMKMLMEKDLKLAIRNMERSIEKKAAIEAQQEKAIAEQQQQSQLQAKQLDRQSKMEAEAVEQEGDIKLQNLKNLGDLRKILAKGRLDLSSKKIDALKELEKTISEARK